MDAPIVFSDITPAHFDAICARAQSVAGIPISGLQGVAQRGTPIGAVEIEWTYTPGSQMLTIQCLKRPPFTAGKVENALRSLVETTRTA